MPTIEVRGDGNCYLDDEYVGPAGSCRVTVKPPKPRLPFDSHDWPRPIDATITWQLWRGDELVREFCHSETVMISDAGEHQPRDTEGET